MSWCRNGASFQKCKTRTLLKKLSPTRWLLICWDYVTFDCDSNWFKSIEGGILRWQRGVDSWLIERCLLISRILWHSSGFSFSFSNNSFRIVEDCRVFPSKKKRKKERSAIFEAVDSNSLWLFEDLRPFSRDPSDPQGFSENQSMFQGSPGILHWFLSDPRDIKT